MTQHKQVSDGTAHAIDEEIRNVIETNYQWAKQILVTNLDHLHAMAEALIKYETIDDGQLRDIMDGKPPQPPAGWDDSLPTNKQPPAPKPAGRACPDRFARRTALAATQEGCDAMQLRCGSTLLDLTLPKVMGVLNVTPDSFSDGGRYVSHAWAIEHAEAMIEAGAAIIDVGGESTRPGAAPVSIEEELRRVIPVVERLARSGRAVGVRGYQHPAGHPRRHRCRRDSHQ